MHKLPVMPHPIPEQTLHECLLTPGTVWLDGDTSDAEQTSYLFTDPLYTLEARTYGDVPAMLRALEEAIARGYHVAGYLAYEAGLAFEAVPPHAVPAEGLGWFGVYRAANPVPAGWTGASERYGARLRLKGPGMDERDYLRRFRAIREAIREGAVYQVNLTFPLDFTFEGEPVGLYTRIRARQPVVYGAFLNPGPFQILSFSPELFFRREGRYITTRPMKGTVGRGRTMAEDDGFARALATDEKNRAENLMIVDLLRNDLARVCVPGSVRVPALFETERHPTVIQMASTVAGRLRPRVGLPDLFGALFPCGSVTGAPRRAAMHLIRALEPTPRGAYCGAIGYAGPGGKAVFSVGIRTAVVSGGEGRMGIGGGIVWDSEPEAEYAEALLKARFLSDG